MRQIVVTNESSILTDAQVQEAVAALQVQITRDFAPAWGLTARLVFQPHAPPATVECVHVLDDSDVAGALGYHTLLTGAVPVGYVFARTEIEAGLAWTVALSHEVLEQLADPYVGLVSLCGYQGQAAALAYEVCDPVESDVYAIAGVPVSNFVLPAWFVPGARAKLDYLGRLRSPLQVGAGGYVSVTTDLRTWTELFGQDSERPSERPNRFSRRQRRQRGR